MFLASALTTSAFATGQGHVMEAWDTLGTAERCELLTELKASERKQPWLVARQEPKQYMFILA